MKVAGFYTATGGAIEMLWLHYCVAVMTHPDFKEQKQDVKNHVCENIDTY